MTASILGRGRFTMVVTSYYGQRNVDSYLTPTSRTCHAPPNPHRPAGNRRHHRSRRSSCVGVDEGVCEIAGETLMTWTDNNGEVRPQDWNEYCEMEARMRCLPYWMTGARFNYQPKPLHPVTRSGLAESREKVLKIRERLFRSSPYCFWCGCKVELGAVGLPHQATVDHLYSRLHPERITRHRQQKGVLHVLACSACNNERSVCEQRGIRFIPKLPQRLEFAQQADATLANYSPKGTSGPEKPMRVICTLEEAIKFAKENPSR